MSSNNQHNISNKKLLKGILERDIPSISRAITLVESIRPADIQAAQQLVQSCLGQADKTMRIGVSGPPGVGKSTFIEALGDQLASKGKSIAVLTVDPSSERSKGSILGDKTRMERLSKHPNAFVRSSPSGGTLGGVARTTKESILILEAAGFEIIFIETVGVGQSETAVSHLVDFFLLLQMPGAGDELQGIKRGIMEVAHGIAINKADGERLAQAERVMATFQQTVGIFPRIEGFWNTKVFSCSGVTGNGIMDIWEAIGHYKTLALEHNAFLAKRQAQDEYWFHAYIKEELIGRFYGDLDIAKHIKRLENDIKAGECTHIAP